PDGLRAAGRTPSRLGAVQSAVPGERRGRQPELPGGATDVTDTRRGRERCYRWGDRGAPGSLPGRNPGLRGPRVILVCRRINSYTAAPSSMVGYPGLQQCRVADHQYGHCMVGSRGWICGWPGARTTAAKTTDGTI